MGQQQETVAGSAVRRMLLVLAVATLMVAMLLVIAAPAFAKGPSPSNCERIALKSGHFPRGCSRTP